jgi:hypothetical protein
MRQQAMGDAKKLKIILSHSSYLRDLVCRLKQRKSGGVEYLHVALWESGEQHEQSSALGYSFHNNKDVVDHAHDQLRKLAAETISFAAVATPSSYFRVKARGISDLVNRTVSCSKNLVRSPR